MWRRGNLGGGASSMNMSCFHCKNEIPIPEVSGRVSVAFRESCSTCGTDLHVCLNCKHYDQGSHHECRESSAEWIRNKEKANVCEYFIPAPPNGRGSKNSPNAARAALDALFKK